MAYKTDERIKDIFRSIGDCGKLKLRVFDNDRDDHKQWVDGGLRFGKYGANDCAWYVEEEWKDKFTGKTCDSKPIIVVEGSFGMERGHTGSAQYTRFHHVLGPVKLGITGIYFLPKVTTYNYRGSSVKAEWRYLMLYAALNVCRIFKSNYLIMDAYDVDSLKDLVIAFSRDKSSLIQEKVEKIKDIMKLFADSKIPKEFKGDYLKYIVRNDNSYVFFRDKICKVLWNNIWAFTTAQYRAGHMIIGESLITRYLFNKEMLLILPRLTKDNYEMLSKTNQKEWDLLTSGLDQIHVITIDDLIFKNTLLESKIRKLILEPLKLEFVVQKNMLAKMLIEELQQGRVKINLND